MINIVYNTVKLKLSYNYSTQSFLEQVHYVRRGSWRQPDELQGDGPHCAGVRAHRGVQHVGQEDMREVSYHASSIVVGNSQFL